MAIEGFDYKNFAQTLAAQADEIIPANFQPFQRDYVINTIQNFATLSGEAIYNDEKLNFNPEQAMLLTQIIAEWSFHKSVDVIKSGIMPEYWDGIMQKVAFTIFEIAKQTISRNLSQDEILQIVEHHVKKSYQEALQELKSRDIIDQDLLERASGQSNIDEMMKQMQEEKMLQENEAAIQNASSQNNSKILKLASVALLLRQIPQEKVNSILNKFNPQDAQAVLQYMQMNDLEQKVDKGIAMKCLQEIKTNLPEPKFINPNKIIARISNAYSVNSEKTQKMISNERPMIKELISKSLEGEYPNMPSKIANVIAQHIEEGVS